MQYADRALDLLPDVAADAASLCAPLDWVGMEGIELPVRFDAGDGRPQRASARIDASVNLARAGQRGIHMSRLYLLLDAQLGDQPIDGAVLAQLLHAFLQSHEGAADRARIRLRFDHFVQRPALRSAHRGWRAYPVRIEASLSCQGFVLELGTDVTYSSTCPASAALSRQSIQQAFAACFDAQAPLDHATVAAWLGSEAGMVATPHAQRSTASLRMRLADQAPIRLTHWLDLVECALGTPVQTAVKREDEQAFARANGANLMFCEDAARRIARALSTQPDIAGFQVRVAHHESLHPHDAVAHASGGIALG